MILHAGLVARRMGGRWRGALITGASGSGKSDLALRLVHLGLRLVADDRVVLWVSDGRLYGRAPDTLRGLMEVRGQGVLPVGVLEMAEVVLCVAAGEVDRLPDPQTQEFLGRRVPLVNLDLKEASAALKVAVALDRL